MEKSSNRSQTFLPGRETSMGRLPSIQSYSIISIIIVICFLFFVFFFKPSPKFATRKRRRQILAVVFRWSAPPKRGSRSVANKRRSRAIRHFKRNLIFGDPRYKRKQQKNKTKQTKQFGRPCRRKRPTWNASRHFSGRIHWEKKNKPEFNKEIQWRRESDRLRRGFSSKLISCFFIFILFTRLTPSSFSCCWRSQHSSTKIIFF